LEKENEIRLSQCMIVKNEEDNIEKALSWGKEIVFEQIVVDTGSTDRTVELAEKLGARVYFFEWCDDFSAAKNFAISKAKGNWIAFLDADEVFPPEDVKKILPILRQITPKGTEAVVSGCMNLNDEGKVTTAGTQIRLFQNLPGIRYHRRIHEQLGWSDQHPMKVVDATEELSILHSGYRESVLKKKNVNRRNLNMILKEVEDGSDSSEMMGYLGDEYYTVGEWEKAEEWYRKAIDAMPSVLYERDQRSAVTFLYLMQILIEKNSSFQELLEIYQKGSSYFPKEADFDYLMGRFCAGRKEWEKGSVYLEQAIQKLEKFGCYNRALLLTGNLKNAYGDAALCFLNSRNFQKAVSFAVLSLRIDGYDLRALSILLNAFKEDGTTPCEEIIKFLKNFYDLTSLKDRLILLKTAKKIGFEELTKQVQILFSAEELEALQQAEKGENLGE